MAGDGGAGLLEQPGRHRGLVDGQRTNATRRLADLLAREGNRLGAKLDGIVKIKYDDDPDKLAAWLIASHLRAANSKDDDDETPPTEGEPPTGNG